MENYYQNADKIIFQPENGEMEINQNFYNILIVDDDEEVHRVTRLVLKDFIFKGNGMNLISAYSGKEAVQILKEHSDIAVVLLDVVMEDEYAGLRLVKHIREVLKNRYIQIILRTGQPGYAPEQKVILEYDINDYRSKPELTAERLITITVSAIRNYQNYMTIRKQNDELLKLISLKNQFIVHLSDDLNRPISEICDKLTSLQKLKYSIDDVHQMIQETDVQVNKIRNTVNKELNILKLEEESINLIQDSVHCCSIIESIINNHKEEIRKRKLNVKLNIPDESDCFKANGMLVESLFDEIISNAIYYNKEGGDITIEGIPEKRFYKFTISDNGCGISSDETAKVFDKFYRSEKILDLNPTGAGLGLFMARKIAKYYGGNVTVKSKAGKGSQFAITLFCKTGYND
jgi:signal transduction histidine kinase